MKDYDKNRGGCSPCEENFERKVNELVHDGEAPTAREHREKAREVEAAYAGSTTSRSAETATDTESGTK